MDKQFHEERRSGVGGSDAAAVLGRSPFRTIHDVWDEKVGYAQPSEPTERQRTGLWLEPAIRARFQDEGRGQIRDAGKFFRSSDHQHMICHVDGICDVNGGAVFEAKTTDGRYAYLWGPSGSDHIPDVYNLQCQHNMIVTGLPETYLAVLIGGSDWRVFRVLLHRGIAEILIDIEADFWNNYVVPVKPPSIDATKACSDSLARQFPEVFDDEVPQSEAIQYHALASRWHAARLTYEEAGARLALVTNELKAAIGTRRRLVTPIGAFTWSPVKRATPDWKAIAKELEIPVEVIGRHTTTKEYRMFRGPRMEDKA